MNIKIENISKSYGNKLVLDNVSFEIKESETCVILGPSGCGKTTLLEIIAGLQNQSSGKIFFEDKDISNLEPGLRNISMVFQNNSLYPNMSVYKNVEFPLKIRKEKSDARKIKVEKALELVNMLDKKKRSVVDLSGGEKQRVAIARALIVNPTLFIMDEPLSSLDSNLRNKTRNEILKIKNSTNTTLLYVTHDQNEARNIADKIIIMDNGKIVQIGTPTELITNPNCLFVLQTFYQDSLNVLTRDEFKKLFKQDLECEVVAFKASNLKESQQGLDFTIEVVDVHTHYNLVRASYMETVVVFKTEKEYKTGDKINLELGNELFLF